MDPPSLIPSSSLDTGLRERRLSERRPSSNARPFTLGAGLTELTRLPESGKVIDGAVVDDDGDRSPDDPNQPSVVAATSTSVHASHYALQPPLGGETIPMHITLPPVIESISYPPGPSVPSTPHGGATPGTLTPTLTRTKAFEADGPLIEHRKAERYKFRLASAFLSFFSCGWADGTPGTIIPHLQTAYGLTYFKVSTLFIAGTIGFAIGTVVNEPLMIKFGRFDLNAKRRPFFPPIFKSTRLDGEESGQRLRIGHSLSQGRLLTLMVGCLCQILYYTIAVLNPPFGLLCVAFCCGGIAISIFSGQMNAYVASASVRTQGRALGNLHGFYGIGAFASPLVCQSLLAAGWAWHRFYWTSFGFSLLNAISIASSFHTTRNEFEYEKEQSLQLAARQAEDNAADSAMPKSTMKAALKLPYVWLFMGFLMFYTGSETTTGGWIVTYLLRQRSANPNTVGYVASGFWGGLAVGRILLGHASPYIGIRKEKHLVHVYIVLSLVMTLIIWFVPSFFGDAICAAMIGLFLGPIFPTSLALATKLLPKEVHLTALAAMSSVASVGSAMFPFVAGVLASARGVGSLQPFMCGILGVMGMLWCFFPSRIGMTA